jgi:hypothetical protein
VIVFLKKGCLQGGQINDDPSGDNESDCGDASPLITDVRKDVTDYASYPPPITHDPVDRNP